MATDLQLLSQELERVEDFAMRLLNARFESIDDVWNLQTDIINYQVKTQDAARVELAAKAELRRKIADQAAGREHGWKDRLRELQSDLARVEERLRIYRHAWLMSRCVGDAFAWVLLKGDERVLLPLTENQKVPSTCSGPSLAGVLSIAESFSRSGAGFPLIHDMTNILRVGDLTFISRDREPETLEVKTSLVEAKDGVQEGSVDTYGTADETFWKSIDDGLARLFPSREPRLDATNQGRRARGGRWNDPKLAEQLKRMGRAKALQAAQPGVSVEIAGRPSVAIEHTVGGVEFQHWNVMNDVARKAKGEGYASACVDDAFVYVALYSESTIFDSDSLADYFALMDRIPVDLVKSGIFLDDPSKNSL